MIRKLALIAAIVFFGGGVRAQDQPSSDDIVKKLMPAPMSRSLRGVSVAPGQEAARPTIDLYINFEFDSAKLDNDGILTLKRLGTALKDPKLAVFVFEIAGHTDAVGTDDYNQALSEKRAKAVVDHLVAFYEIAPARLKAAGYGKTKLRDASKPNDGVNRRVQITNIGE